MVIPRVDVVAGIVPVLPSAATFWMPDDDPPADGLGGFRGVWPLTGVTPADAAALLAREQAVIRELDASAPDARTFDRLARQREAADSGLGTRSRPLDLGGLEIGVAGLTYALAAIGCVPAASCRGHVGEDAWSYHPIVFLAVDRPRADWLLPRVRRAKCGFGVGAGRENLLVIQAASLVDTVRLATVILREAQVIPPPAREPR